jgi:hypothetical protein
VLKGCHTEISGLEKYADMQRRSNGTNSVYPIDENVRILHEAGRGLTRQASGLNDGTSEALAFKVELKLRRSLDIAPDKL